LRKEKNNKALKAIYRSLYGHYGPRHWWPGDTKLEIIVGAILTQNTAWTNVEKAVKNLKKEKVLTVKKLSSISEKKLSRLIRPAGYYNIKARRIKNFLRFLNNFYGGNIRRMFRTRTDSLRNELLAVNGIGPETADSILLYAGEKPVFVVDAYTKRIFSRHGYIKESANYDEVQEFFLKRLPLNAGMFNEFHALIVELGKKLCRRKKPLCNICPIRRKKK